MTDKTKDVFGEAAALALKKFPPRLVTITQDKSQLERIYPVADVSQLKGLHVDEESVAALIANTIKVF